MVAKRIILDVEDLEGDKDQNFWEDLTEGLMEYAESLGVEAVAELQNSKGEEKDGKKER